MSAQFDLEQQIMECWRVCDDINILYEYVMDKGLSTDAIANALLGMKTLYELKFDRCFSTFETFLSEKRTRLDDRAGLESELSR